MEAPLQPLSRSPRDEATHVESWNKAGVEAVSFIGQEGPTACGAQPLPGLGYLAPELQRRPGPFKPAVIAALLGDAKIDLILTTVRALLDVGTAACALLDGDRCFVQGGSGRTRAGSACWADTLAAWPLLEPAGPDGVVTDMCAAGKRAVGRQHLQDYGFYVSASLLDSQGCRVGMLCVADSEPRTAPGAHACAAAALAGLAQLLAIEAARAGAGALGELRPLPRAPATLDAPHVCVEVTPAGLGEWRVVGATPAAAAMLDNALADGAKPFLDVFRASGGVAVHSMPMAIHQRAIEDGRDFLVKRMCPATTVGGGRVFDMHFRPALPVSPGQSGSPAACRHLGPWPAYYFAELQPVAETELRRMTRSQSAPTRSLDKAPWDDLELGGLVRDDAGGRTYRATFQGTCVTAKVCSANKVRTMAGVPLEAVLSAETPTGLVPTVAFTTARCMHSAHQRQTWLLQAYCNRGTLADAMEQGWFTLEDGLPDIGAIAATLAEVAEGLAAIHALGVAHGFFSAEKVLLAAAPRAPHGFRAFVADYGLAPPDGAPPLSQADDVAAFGELLHELVKRARPAAPGYTSSFALTRTTSAPPNCARLGPPPALLVLAKGCRSADPADHPTMEQAREICQHVWQSVAPLA
ncbi:hypothetical protein WJX81_005870 [Elliptochloris bilobata]|uniref:Protein kinase domain-containing protein n=1 Tax=Elliptochloris bilobata TaxID=381761 RepID=A0AAW1RDT9_9CHLO